MFSPFRMFLPAVFLLLAGLSPASAEPPAVVATIRPLHGVAAAVMKGAGAPALLIRDASSVHHYALRPSGARMLARAALVFLVNEAGLETFLLGRLEDLAPRARILRAADAPGVRLLGMRPLNPPGAGASPGAGAGHNAVNWHVWLDPHNARAMASALARALAEMDPPNAALYRDNAKAFSRRLDAVERGLEKQLAPVRGRPFIVTHDATLYFEKRFGLRAIASIHLPGDASPGLSRVLAVVALARKHPGICVFATPDAPAKWSAMLAREASARPAIVDPVGFGLKPGPDLLPRLLEDLGRAFSGCLRGGG